MTTPVTANFDWFATMTVKMNAYATPGTRLDTVASGSSMINCTNTTTLAGTCSAGFPKNASLTLTYSGVVTGGTNDWSACTLGLHNIHVSGSGDCAPPPLGLDQTASKCMITFSARGAFTSEGDVGCQ
jgi:hypothetical protein